MKVKENGIKVVDLGWGVARLTYAAGWRLPSGDWEQWITEDQKKLAMREVKLTEITILQPHDEGTPAQSVYVNKEGCDALRDALAEEAPFIAD